MNNIFSKTHGKTGMVVAGSIFLSACGSFSCSAERPEVVIEHRVASATPASTSTPPGAMPTTATPTSFPVAATPAPTGSPPAGSITPLPIGSASAIHFPGPFAVGDGGNDSAGTPQCFRSLNVPADQLRGKILRLSFVLQGRIDAIKLTVGKSCGTNWLSVASARLKKGDYVIAAGQDLEAESDDGSQVSYTEITYNSGEGVAAMDPGIYAVEIVAYGTSSLKDMALADITIAVVAGNGAIRVLGQEMARE